MRTREHLFRGKYTDGNGKTHWIVGHYTEGAYINPNTGEGTKRYIISNEDGLFDVAPESVGEWTGFWDASEPPKRIFEDDVIESQNGVQHWLQWDDETAGFQAHLIQLPNWAVGSGYRPNQEWIKKYGKKVVANYYDSVFATKCNDIKNE